MVRRGLSSATQSPTNGGADKRGGASRLWRCQTAQVKVTPEAEPFLGGEADGFSRTGGAGEEEQGAELISVPDLEESSKPPPAQEKHTQSDTHDHTSKSREHIRMDTSQQTLTLIPCN